MNIIQPEHVNCTIPSDITLTDLIDIRAIPMGYLVSDYLMQYGLINLDDPDHVILNSLLRTTAPGTLPEALQIRAIYAYIQTYGGDTYGEILSELTDIINRKERISAFLKEYRKSPTELMNSLNVNINHSWDPAVHG